MKTIVKAILSAAAAVLLALAFSRLLFGVLGLDAETNTLEDFGDSMLQARSLFVARSGEFQDVAAALEGQSGLFIRRTAGGRPVLLRAGAVVPAEELLRELGASDSEALAQALQRLYDGAEVSSRNSDGEELTAGHCQVWSVAVSDWGVAFYTDCLPAGFVGVALVKPGQTPPYPLVELVEDWQIFYRMDEE